MLDLYLLAISTHSLDSFGDYLTRRAPDQRPALVYTSTGKRVEGMSPLLPMNSITFYSATLPIGYDDLSDGDWLYVVAPGLHFVWPFIEEGKRV